MSNLMLIVAGIVGCAALGAGGTAATPPPPACGADTALAARGKEKVILALTRIDATSKGLPHPPTPSTIVQVTQKNTCTAVTNAYNARFPTGHSGRIPNSIYLFKIGTNRYAVAYGGILEFFDPNWVSLLALADVD